MSTATISSKGQITLPVSLRRALDLKPGDKIELLAMGKRAILTKARSGDILAYVRALEPTPGAPLSDREMDVAVAEEVSKHYDRKHKESKG